jgi:hypothetical protein
MAFEELKEEQSAVCGSSESRPCPPTSGRRRS